MDFVAEPGRNKMRETKCVSSPERGTKYSKSPEWPQACAGYIESTCCVSYDGNPYLLQCQVDLEAEPPTTKWLSFFFVQK